MSMWSENGKTADDLRRGEALAEARAADERRLAESTRAYHAAVALKRSTQGWGFSDIDWDATPEERIEQAQQAQQLARQAQLVHQGLAPTYQQQQADNDPHR